jgi:hypothetical protein
LYTISDADGNGYSYSYKIQSDAEASAFASTAPVAFTCEKQTHYSIRSCAS